MRKIIPILALLVLLMVSACSFTTEPSQPSDTPAGSTPIDPNRIQPGTVFYSFPIEQKENYITEGRIYIHVIRPEESTGAVLTAYADESEAYKESGTFIISASDKSVAFGSLGSDDLKYIGYDETGEAELIIDAVASTKGTLTISVTDFNDKSNSIALQNTLPEGAASVNMGFQAMPDVPFADMEVFTTSLIHRTDNT